MSRFLEFEPNPFLVNAFTLSGVSPTEVLPRGIKDLIRSRREEVDSGVEITIPAADAPRVVSIADLNAAETCLLNPNVRLDEELLVATPPPSPEFGGVAAFQEQHALSRGKVDQLLSFAPIDPTALFLAHLPETPIEHKPAAGAMPVLPTLRLAGAAWFVKDAARRG